MPDVKDTRPTMEEAATLLKLFAENQPPLVKAFFEGMDRHYSVEGRKPGCFSAGMNPVISSDILFCSAFSFKPSY